MVKRTLEKCKKTLTTEQRTIKQAADQMQNIQGQTSAEAARGRFVVEHTKKMTTMYYKNILGLNIVLSQRYIFFEYNFFQSSLIY